jgi:hypothetical protein
MSVPLRLWNTLTRAAFTGTDARSLPEAIDFGALGWDDSVTVEVFINLRKRLVREKPGVFRFGEAR